MLYDLRHRVRYTYETAVPESRQLFRMTPVSRRGQRVVASSLDILPEPAERYEGTDFYGNAFTGAVIDRMHWELTVETRARLEVDRGPVPDLGATPAWRRIRAAAPLADGLDPDSPVHFIFPTRLVPVLEQVTDYAGACFGAETAIGTGAMSLAQRIRSELRYDPEATDVATPVQASFEARAGVCQDFAHIMLAGIRGLGLPCRYVSGYLRTDPPPGQPRLEGADATHAWVDVWCGTGAGWIGFDPTNAILALDDHIVLGVGRDYSDVAPIEGVIRLYGGHSLEVGVDVVPVETGSLSGDAR